MDEPRAHGFNGAAPVKERKTTPENARPAQDRRFNGAAPVKERKTPLTLPTAHPIPCFNGAAPVKERKTGTSGHDAAIAGRLQWGRSGEGAEDGELDVQRRPRRRLQWGRSGEGAEDERVLMHAAGLDGRFNGAAPVKERKTM